jgi:hypothetical protein
MHTLFADTDNIAWLPKHENLDILITCIVSKASSFGL